MTLLLLGCQGNEKKSPSQGAGAPAPMVNTLKVAKEDITLSFEYPARIKSASSADIVARVGGLITEKHFVEGSFVKKDALLYVIDPLKYQAQHAAAQAQVAIDEATLKKTNREWERARLLFEEKALSEKERDEILAAYESALAKLKSSRAILENAKIDLGYTQVRASIAGFTGIKQHDVGDLVGTNTQNSTLLTITQLDPIFVEFSIPEFDRSLMGSKESIQVSLKSAQSLILNRGKVDYIDHVVDEGVASLKARALFDNKESNLIPGGFVRIKLDGIVKKELLTLPQKVVLQGPQGPFVYGIVDQKATPRPIKISKASLLDRFIIESGLSEGEVVIADNLPKIRPGMAVALQQKSE